jgi:ssDNA-binding replication factor A large subunit
VIPIASLADVDRGEVSIRGEVKVLWESSSSKIAQVGLVEDESGVTKFTSWERSNQPAIREGEEVILRGVKTSWYEGRVSVAVTGWSEIQFPERERWWTE